MKVLVLIADGEPDSSGDILKIENLDLSNLENRNMTVPVNLNFSHKPEDCIGFAKLSVEGNNVYADIEFLDTEKANLKKSLPMYPAIGGYCTGRDVNNHKMVTGFSISSIAFNHNENSDKRIEKV